MSSHFSPRDSSLRIPWNLPPGAGMGEPDESTWTSWKPTTDLEVCLLPNTVEDALRAGTNDSETQKGNTLWNSNTLLDNQARPEATRQWLAWRFRTSNFLFPNC